MGEILDLALVKTSREQGNGVRFAWLKEIAREIARKVERRRKRERERERKNIRPAEVRRGGERERRADSRTNGSRSGERD